MAALGLHVSLDSSALSSCTSFRATRVPAVCNAQTVKLGKVGGIRCSLSEEDSVPSVARRNALTRLVATGLALTLSTSSAFADVGPFTKVGEVTSKKADKLLKEADKLTNNDSPPRFGPSRGGIPGEDEGRIAQKGGSGAIPDLQNKGSELVGEARDKYAEKTELTKQRFDESIGSAQDKAGEVKENVQGFFGQAKDTAQDKVEETKKNAKGLFGKGPEKLKGEAQGKAEEAKQNVQGFFGQGPDKLKGGVQGKVEETKQNVQGKAEETKQNAQGFFGQAQGKGKGLVGDAQGKAGSVQGKVKSDVDNAAEAAKGAAGDATENANGLIGSIKKGLRIQ